MLDSLTLTGPCRSTSPRKWQDVKKPFQLTFRAHEGSLLHDHLPCLTWTAIHNTVLTVPHFEVGDIRIPNLAQERLHGVPWPHRGHLSYLGGVATLWDNGLVPETLIVECPTAYVPSRNVPSALWGRRYQPPVIL